MDGSIPPPDHSQDMRMDVKVSSKTESQCSHTYSTEFSQWFAKAENGLLTELIQKQAEGAAGTFVPTSFSITECLTKGKRTVMQI